MLLLSLFGDSRMAETYIVGKQLQEFVPRKEN